MLGIRGHTANGAANRDRTVYYASMSGETQRRSSLLSLIIAAQVDLMPQIPLLPVWHAPRCPGEDMRLVCR
jgi:hypothetical protein